MSEKKNELEDILKSLDLVNCDKKPTKLLHAYMDLLFRWHEKNNILSTRDRGYFIQRDLFDSLSMMQYLPIGDLLDIGTGAGIPGMLISFFRPDANITLLDRRENAIRFLEHAKLKLSINNVSIIKSDAKKMNIQKTIDAVLIKNFSNKIISKLSFENKLMYIIKMIREQVLGTPPIYMLTGSIALSMDNQSEEFRRTSKSKFSVKKIDTPYFDTNRYMLVIEYD